MIGNWPKLFTTARAVCNSPPYSLSISKQDLVGKNDFLARMMMRFHQKLPLCAGWVHDGQQLAGSHVHW